MGARLLVLHVVLLFQGLRLCFSGDIHAMESVPDLVKSMYKVVDGYPCVRLLNLTGEIGCGNPGRSIVASAVVRFRSSEDLRHRSAVLVPLDEFQELLTRITKDPNYAKNVGGVLVDSGYRSIIEKKGFSPDQKFPDVEFSGHQNKSYAWNPVGSGIMWRSYNFPIFLLSNESTEYMREVVLKNENKEKSYKSDVVEFDLVMQTTKSGTYNSESCLREETCLPLGGYSVWSSLPPINVPSERHAKPIILAVSSMDSSSFFRDKGLGAQSPISGLISLLAVVDSLSRLKGLSEFSKQLVFAVFTGEAWGFLGSRRFLHELDLHSDAVKGIDRSLIDMVIEIGSVGRGFNQENTTFFVHNTEESSAVNEAWSALKYAQDSLRSENINVLLASTSNPGIPPSSLMAFLGQNSSTSGIVLADFNTVFSNKFYNSLFDDKSNINSSSIVAAATLTARALYRLASGQNLSDSALNAINVNSSLVEELIGCFLDCDPGFSCELVKKYIVPTTACPSHYVGVITGDPSASPSSGVVNDFSRFIWNFLADVTSPSEDAYRPSCSHDCDSSNHACIKAETDGKGVCVISSTRYVPAYSTRLKYEAGTWNVLPPNSSDPMGDVDPVWTESNWDTIGMRVYTVQNAALDRIVLLIGISVTTLAYIVILFARATLDKASKRD